MPQIAKGGKWVFGWVIIGPRGEIPIPPEAYLEYGFQPGESVIFIEGSRTSGGFGMGRFERLVQSKTDLLKRSLGQGLIDQKHYIAHPPKIGLKPGDRLLVGRGSGFALGFLQHGPIIQEALLHPEIETFSI